MRTINEIITLTSCSLSSGVEAFNLATMVSKSVLFLALSSCAAAFGLAPILEVTRRDAILSSAVSVSACSLFLPKSSSLAASIPFSAVVNLPGTDIGFPLASFGLQVYDDQTAYALTLMALEVGYRNFFASVLARNQKGFARAIKDSGIDRKDLFICGSVVSNRASGFKEAYELTTRGWKQNMEKFSVGDISYLDQIMLDYPGPDDASILGQWKAFQEMHDKGLVRTLSVSNFSPAQLDCLLQDANTRVKPCVNQLPYSVAYHKDSIEEHKKRDILVQAWAPLGGSLGGRFNGSMKAKCAAIGKTYNKTGYQVALRWIVQTGAAFTTQSTKKEHFIEDLDVFNFELTPQEMLTLSSLA